MTKHKKNNDGPVVCGATDLGPYCLLQWFGAWYVAVTWKRLPPHQLLLRGPPVISVVMRSSDDLFPVHLVCLNK